MNLAAQNGGRRAAFLLAGLLFLTSVLAGKAQENDFVEDRWVVILSAYSDFASAKADAEKLAKNGKIPFSMDGRIYDKKRGLIYPGNSPDEPFAGSYVARRYNETEIGGKDREYLSVERSDGYAGFKPGFYIVVAGIYANQAAAAKQVARFKGLAPSAYSKKTRIYMGCLH